MAGIFSCGFWVKSVRKGEGVGGHLGLGLATHTPMLTVIPGSDTVQNFRPPASLAWPDVQRPHAVSTAPWTRTSPVLGPWLSHPNSKPANHIPYTIPYHTTPHHPHPNRALDNPLETRRPLPPLPTSPSHRPAEQSRAEQSYQPPSRPLSPFLAAVSRVSFGPHGGAASDARTHARTAHDSAARTCDAVAQPKT